MRYARFHTNIEGKLIGRPITERTILRLISILAAALALALAIIQFIEIDRVLDQHEYSLWGVTISYTTLWLRIRIAVAHAINSTVIWPFKPKSFLISALTMLWVIIEYVLWFNWSFRVRESLGTGHLPEPSAAGLYAAIWPDLIVLLLTLVIVVWIVKIAALGQSSDSVSH
jgi:hypothetical protein